MRIRQVKPAFWSDARVASLPEGTRLFYIGLWMVADDVGWFRWDPIEVSRDLYGYDSRIKREKRVVTMFDALAAVGRVVLQDCGRHAIVPTLPEHQHLAGATKQVRTAYAEHAKECLPAMTRDDPHSPADARSGNGKERVMVGNGSVSQGNGVARASADALALRDAEDEAERRKLRAVR